jgi:hypothetical protein
VDVLAELDVGTSGIFLRRARSGDVAAIVSLLAADQLTTDKTRTDAHRFYERLGFVASHEGMKLMLDQAGRI